MVHSPTSELARLSLPVPEGGQYPEPRLLDEWLETDGLGGYASSTVAACATRRYHGLLVARPPGSTSPHVFLSRLEEEVLGPEGSGAISCACYPGVLCPEGHRTIVRFELRPHPLTEHRVAELTLSREVQRPRGTAAVLVRYRLLDGDGCELRLRPLLSCRDAHSLTAENALLDPRSERIEGGLRWRPYQALPAVALTLSAPFEWDEDPSWYHRIEYPADQQRGYGGTDDAWSPGTLRVQLGLGGELVLCAALAEPVADPLVAWAAESASRPRAFIPGRDAEPDLRAELEAVADDYLYRDEAGRLGVIAGYPWLGERARDTFICLPGLLLARGRVEECGRALGGALPHLSEGRMPLAFGLSPAESVHGPSDVALWFARAAVLYREAGGERERVMDELAPALASIAEHLLAASPPDLCIDEGGLPWVADPSIAATWMDARAGGEPVTPRHGSAVELAALWYALLAELEGLAAEAGDARSRRRWAAERRRARRAFLARFWLPDEDEPYLADVWRPGHVDRSVRPNMVIAASIEKSPLARRHRAAVVARARRELLTPVGLRSLSQLDPAYVPRYGGGPAERERAAHQGSVWPWLLGPWCEASLRAAVSRRREARSLRAQLATLTVALRHTGLGHLSELHDGDPPHRPAGAIAQAWNVAELLRALALLDELA